MTTIAASIALPVTMRRHVAETARTETRSRASEAPARTEAPRHDDGARRSPLYRALIGALRELLAPPPAPAAAAAPAPAVSTAPAGTAAPVDAASVPPTEPIDASDDVEQALMNFTRALMQTLRGEQDGPGRHGHGRHDHAHHAHHDNGRRAWGDPARRIEQLGVQMAAAPVDAGPAPVAVTAATSSAESAPSTTAANTTVASAAPRPADSHLLSAFRELQQALGHNEAGGGAEASIGTRLANFLRSLADRLAQDAPAVTDLATQPGALIDLQA